VAIGARVKSVDGENICLVDDDNQVCYSLNKKANSFLTYQYLCLLVTSLACVVWLWYHFLNILEIARYENARNAIVWNTECCICLSIAEQECMSRQERHQISPPTVFLGFSV